MHTFAFGVWGATPCDRPKTHGSLITSDPPSCSATERHVRIFAVPKIPMVSALESDGVSAKALSVA